MIWWGKSKPKGKVYTEIPDVACPNCHDIGELYIIGYTKYFHIYWIPLFSIGKKTKVCCDICEKTFKVSKVHDVSAEEVKELKSQIKRPAIWHFSGSIAFIILFVIAIFQNNNQDELDLEYLATPTVNDVYHIDMHQLDGDYCTTWKIVTVSEDSLQFVKNKFKASTYWTFNKEVDEEENQSYTTDTISFERSKMKAFYEKEAIMEINRE